MQERRTKTKQVKEHLIKRGSITSMEAINLYYATRLSAIIFNLKKYGMDIVTEMVNEKDCNGNACTFAKYIYKGETN